MFFYVKSWSHPTELEIILKVYSLRVTHVLRVCFNYVPSTGIRLVGDVLRCTMGFITIIHHYLGECVFELFPSILSKSMSIYADVFTYI